MATVNKDVRQSESRFDAVKWAFVTLLVVAGVWGNVYFNEVVLLYRVLGLVVLGIVAVLVALQTHKGALFWGMLKEAKSEVRRVVWPTRPEVSQTTLIVVVVVLLMGLVLWGVDTFLAWLVQKFIS